MKDVQATACYAPPTLAGVENGLSDDLFERIVANFSRYAGIAGLVTVLTGLAFWIV